MSFLNTQNTDLIWTLDDYLINYVKSGRFSVDDSGLLRFTDNNKRLVVVPAALRKSILRNTHGSLHHGSGKMRHLIKDRYWWPKYYKEIRDFAALCSSCQHSKRGRVRGKKQSKLKLFPANKPFQHVSTDIVGPLPITKNGYRYIVTMIDKFSRYCMLIPVKNIKAMTVLKALEHWITIFGPPEAILSDNGTQFTSALYKSYDNHNGTKIKYATSYHPECNGQIERLHRWIKERLALISCDTGKDFVNDIDDDWSDYLNVIQYTYNSTPNKMTQYAPSEIIFGHKVRLPIDFELKNPFSAENTPKEYIEYMIKRYQPIVTVSYIICYSCYTIT